MLIVRRWAYAGTVALLLLSFVSNAFPMADVDRLETVSTRNASQSANEAVVPPHVAGQNEEKEQTGNRAAGTVRDPFEGMQWGFVVWAVLTCAVSVAALLLALKKERVVNVVHHISRRLRYREGEVNIPGQPVRKLPAYGMRLTGYDGDGKQIRIDLLPDDFGDRRSEQSFGRHPDLVNEVVADEKLSRRHARVTVHSGQFHIEDLNSRNGTYLNGQKLKPFHPLPLHAGDRIRMAGLELNVSNL